jgi:hypothetical protein
VPHMVIFRTADGKPSYHQAEVLNEAIRFVEHLRNEEQVNDARIFAMAEVPIEFKVQWRVELAAPAARPSPTVPVPVVAPAAVPAAEVPVPAVADVAEAVDSDAVAAEPADDETADHAELSPYGEVQSEDEVGVAAGIGGAPLPAASSSRFGLFNRG